MPSKYLPLAVSSLVLLVAAACGGSDDDGEPLPELTPFGPAQTERLHAIRDGIAELRGLPAVEDLEEGSISREEWQEFGASDPESLTGEEQEELDFYNAVWRLMRLLGPDEDMLEGTNQAYGTGVTGFYSPSDEALVLVEDGSEGDLTLSEEYTIAHEYVHSFQDAHFDIEELRKIDAPEEGELSELATTIGCVIEGDASAASLLYMLDEHGFAWALSASEEEASQESIDAMLEVPAIILEYVSFNYDECLTFALVVQDDLGWEGIDAMFEAPPTTTEQVLHSQKYYDREPALEVPDTDLTDALGNGWERDEVQAFGEFDVHAILTAAGLFPDKVDAAAGGWGGGRMAVYRGESTDDGPPQVVAHLTLRWDSREDFDEFGAIFHEMLGLQDWNLAQESDHWHWWEGDDAGYAVWDEAMLQYDIVYATDAATAEAARDALREGFGTE